MLNRIRLLFRTLAPLEQAVLESLPPLLPRGAAEVCRLQIGAITRVQRVLNWTEVCFYRIRRGRPCWDGVPLFDRRGEFRLSESKYVIEGVAYTSSVWCVDGHLFSLVTRPSSKDGSFRQPECLETRLLVDPTQIGGSAKMLPTSYVDWYGNHGRHVDWDVLPPEETYAVPLPEGDFVVLATRRSAEFLVTPADSTEERFFRVEPGRSLIPIGETFSDAIRNDGGHHASTR